MAASLISPQFPYVSTNRGGKQQKTQKDHLLYVLILAKYILAQSQEISFDA